MGTSSSTYQGVVRFITCGSVDDGKSTLIGRLLYDTKAVLADQLAALSKTKHARVTANDAQVDLALLTDGLEAEREQGITIDVAYRYFATAQRKFIVADAPGHEQYTRNMVTGASQADVAVLLVDATRVDLSQTPAVLLPQTRRHLAIVKLLGLKHVLVAVNKMDLKDYDQKVFFAIEESVHHLAQQLDLPQPELIPVSALQGDNIVKPSEQMAWYQGPSLLQSLEQVDISHEDELDSLRLPIQYVARQDGSAADDFRGYLGRIESGTLYQGQHIKLLPSGATVTVTEIHTPTASYIDKATVGQVVAVRLDQDVDVSRGDLIVANDEQESPSLAQTVQADLCWLDREPLSLARKYVLRHTTNTVFAKIKSIEQVWDVQTLSHATDIHELKTNEIGRVQLTLQKPIAADVFTKSHATGSFILIDEVTNHTVAAGMVRTAGGI